MRKGEGMRAPSILRFPELDRIALRVMEARETAIGIRGRVDRDFDPVRLKLFRHGVEIAHAEVHHPHLRGISEVGGLLRKRFERGDTRLLLPSGVFRSPGQTSNAEIIFVPLFQRFRIPCAEEKPPNASDTFHYSSFPRWTQRYKMGRKIQIGGQRG